VPHLERLACRIFSKARRYDKARDKFSRVEASDKSTIKPISFGVREYDKPRPKYFVESRVTGLGKTQRAAQKVKIQELLAEGYDVDMLNYAQRNFSHWDSSFLKLSGLWRLSVSRRW
jgi:hypothetical protein